MSYQGKYAKLQQTGLPILSTLNYREIPKVGKLDEAMIFSLTLVPATLNANAGKEFVLFKGKAGQRYRLVSIQGVADSAISVLSSGLSLEFRYNSTAKGVVNLTAGVAANAAIPLSTTPNGAASAAAESLVLAVVGAGSVSCAVPISIRFTLVQEPTV